MELLPMRSSAHTTAIMPDAAVLYENPNLFAGADEIGNCAQVTLPLPFSLIACSVDNPNPGESTQKTSAPLPVCTFSTNTCESEPSGTITKPVEPHCDAPCPLNFCP